MTRASLQLKALSDAGPRQAPIHGSTTNSIYPLLHSHFPRIQSSKTSIKHRPSRSTLVRIEPAVINSKIDTLPYEPLRPTQLKLNGVLFICIGLAMVTHHTRQRFYFLASKTLNWRAVLLQACKKTLSYRSNLKPLISGQDRT